MKELSYTLLTDGSSDKVLLPILTWLLQEYLSDRAIQSEWANVRGLPKLPKKLSLSERIEIAIEYYPCDLLFVHRDAEREPRENRVAEIQQAVKEAGASVPVVCVVPVRMTEAWLLFDEVAIRTAADNPNSKRSLQLPHRARVENEPDPKELLYTLLREASELGGKRRKKFKVNDRVHRVAELTDDFSPLRQLSAFQALEADIQQIIQNCGWNRI